jgi:hypothetical protein
VDRSLTRPGRVAQAPVLVPVPVRVVRVGPVVVTDLAVRAALVPVARVARVLVPRAARVDLARRGLEAPAVVTDRVDLVVQAVPALVVQVDLVVPARAVPVVVPVDLVVTDRADPARRAARADRVSRVGLVNLVNPEDRADLTGLVAQAGPVAQVSPVALVALVDLVGRAAPADLGARVDLDRMDRHRLRMCSTATTTGVVRSGVALATHRTGSARRTMERRPRRPNTDSGGTEDLPPGHRRPTGTGHHLLAAGTDRHLLAAGTRIGMDRRAT